MWIKNKIIKTNKTGQVYRYTCSVCGKETDSCKIPKKCKHDLGYNLNSIWLEILRSALGLKSGRKRLKITISKKFVLDLFNKQKGKCALSGVNIFLGNTASLDRIDSSIGYTKENIQWVHKDINFMKGSFSEKYMKEMCANVEKFTRASA